jgi:hypothetical protein
MISATRLGRLYGVLVKWLVVVVQCCCSSEKRSYSCIPIVGTWSSALHTLVEFCSVESGI